MTRRLIVYQLDTGEYAVSQEFNGDRNELTKLHGSSRHPVRANWPTIVALFNGVTTQEGFKRALFQAESFYGYTHDFLTVVGELPTAEEVWLLSKGKLSLVRRYDEDVKMADTTEYFELHSKIQKSLHKLSGGRVFQMLDGASYLPIPWDEGKHNYTPSSYADMKRGQFSEFMPMYGNVKPVHTAMARLY